MQEEVRVRFAPSPTGYLHVGGGRTALFNWLFARKNNGKFILRIEDTDLTRSSQGMIQAILDGLNWLGLDWDEDPIFQSERIHIYRDHVDKLMAAGKAYYCYCSSEVLKQKREVARREGRPWKYDGACRNLTEEQRRERESEGASKVVRFRVPGGATVVEDLVHGALRFENEAIEDFVVLRSDGLPTYHLAVVVDDALLRISHVIRGDDHVSNTPKQVLLYKALGFEAPQFAHLPLILGPDRKRLSKRHGAVSVTEYRDNGYLPEAVVNFLALLGWSPGDGREILSREELIESFSLEGINKANAIFDERKLEWMNGQYLNFKPSEELFLLVVEELKKAGLIYEESAERKREWLLKVIDLLKVRVRKLTDFPELGRYFFEAPKEYEEKGVKKHWKGPEAAGRLSRLSVRLERLDDNFTSDKVEGVVRGLAGELGLGAGKLIHPTRLAITGRSFGPGLFEVMELLGKEAVVERLEKAIEYLANN